MTIKAAEFEASTLYVAGEAPPGSTVRVFAGDELVGAAQSSAEGTWLLQVDRDVPPGEVSFRAEAVEAGGTVPVAEAQAPFMRFEDGIVSR